MLLAAYLTALLPAFFSITTVAMPDGATCTVTAYSDKHCTDQKGSTIGIPKAPDTKCIRVSDGGAVRHSVNISAGCPSLHVVFYSGTGCKGGRRKSEDWEAGCHSFNEFGGTESILVHE